MKHLLLTVGVVFGISTHSSLSLAAKVNCNNFSKEADSFKAEASKKQKQLDTLDAQVQSGTKAINEYNKNCRAASGPNCNPVMFNMISGQMTTLMGQRQKVQLEILTAKDKQDEATKNLKSCKDAVKAL